MREGSGLVEFERRFPERYFDVGIAEQHAVTFAAGLACGGIKPVVADAFDAEGLLKIVGDIRPDVVFHELTAPPDGLAAD